MKIILINPSLQCGGSERVVCELANYWSQNGHDITILTTDREEEPYFKLEKQIERIGILKGFSTSIIASPWRKLSAIRTLRQEVQARQPDAVICFQEMNSIYSMFALRKLAVPKIVAVRNHPGFKKLTKFYANLRKKLYPKAKYIIVQTEAIKNWFIEEGFPQDKLRTIQNPLSSIDINEAVSQENTIYACGRLETQKGFAELIEIFSSLSPQFPAWKLQIIGDGSQRNSLETLAKEKNISDKIIFTGTHDNPTSFYAPGDIFAFTSHYEGFPNALCEAMAAGMAVVSMNCPSGPADLINDGQNGFLVEPGNKEIFAQKLTKLMGNKELRNQMGQEAQKLNKTLSIEKISDQWMALIS